VVRNAFIAAALGPSSSYQNPISRYEHSPITSHEANMSRRSSASTNASMAAVNSDRTAKNQPLRASSRM